MQITKKKENKNDLLNRKETRYKISFRGKTPSRKKITEKIAAETGASEETVIVKQINQKYGKQEAECKVRIYDSEEAAKETERYSLKRKKEAKKVEEPEKEEKPETEEGEETEEKEEQETEETEEAEEDEEEKEKEEDEESEKEEESEEKEEKEDE